jgi:hypothetical protein
MVCEGYLAPAEEAKSRGERKEKRPHYMRVVWACGRRFSVRVVFFFSLSLSFFYRVDLISRCVKGKRPMEP